MIRLIILFFGFGLGYLIGKYNGFKEGGLYSITECKNTKIPKDMNYGKNE